MNLFSNILYLSEAGADQASSLERAVTMAENSLAKLTVIDVVPVLSAGIGLPAGGPISEKLQTHMVSDRRQELEALVEPYRERLDIQIDVLVGTRFIQAIRAVLRNHYDLLIKPVENPDFIQRLFGSDDMQLLRNCPCPLWLVREAEKTNYENILAAVDFDLDNLDTEDQGLNRQILDLSSSLALSDFAALHLAHVWEAPGELSIRLWSDDPETASVAYLNDVRSRHEAALEAFRKQFKERIGEETYDYLAPSFHLYQGAAATVIPELAEKIDADLVVMGTVARTGIAGLLIGNTAEAILEQLQCSVLAIKPSGFVSPVTLPKE
ncbi:universal stress protein [Sedimenticola thiotaurini]|uniref:Universal stress protein n=1 Tax=Sedimenticola thiotaurini TaxID=1543721 RepID=A0A0F7JYK9_9GAMM|nr:universal stress protein [Sedimenticola thiotaurini]AKH20364.1 universal stress protein [Sedimenticola thiotaurini]